MSRIRLAASAGSSVARNERTRLDRFIAAEAQAGLRCTYAPRPGARPERSTATVPAGLRTTRNSSDLGAVLRHPTQVRSGARDPSTAGAYAGACSSCEASSASG